MVQNCSSDNKHSTSEFKEGGAMNRVCNTLSILNINKVPTQITHEYELQAKQIVKVFTIKILRA